MVKMWLHKINSRNSNLADLEQEILSFFHITSSNLSLFFYSAVASKLKMRPC